MRFLLPGKTSLAQAASDLTNRQIEEAKRLAAECEAQKNGLVAKANGAFVKLKGVTTNAGESKD